MHDRIMTLHRTWASLTLSKHMTRQITRYYYASSKSAREPPLNLLPQFKQSTQILFWKGIGRDPPDYRSTTGWKHDAGPIPLPFDGICGDSWSCMDTSRNLHSQRDDSQQRTFDWRKICSHTPAMLTSKDLTACKILQCLLCVDNDTFPLAQGETCNKGWNSYTIKLADSVWKCTSDEGREHPKPNVFSSPPHSSSTSIIHIHRNMRQLSWQSNRPSASDARMLAAAPR